LSTVLNIAQLFLLMGLGFLYFMGLGWLVMEFQFHRYPAVNYKNVFLLQKIPLAATLGFIVNYGISLLVQSTSLSLIVGIAVSLFGIWRILHCCRLHDFTKHNSDSPNNWMGVAFVLLLYLAPILVKPLTDWDARSIWFFHAKMIYTAGSFGMSAGWQHPSVAFSHADYPNLVPGIAAQASQVLGYWNEYIPKISLFFVFIPVVMWLFTFARKSFSFAALILLFPFSIFPWIWNGYMDGFLALYLSVAMLLLGRYIRDEKPIDLISSLVCLMFLIYIKNEGQLAMLAGILSVIVVCFSKRKKGEMGIKQHKFSLRSLVTGSIVLLPFAVWSICKHKLGLSNDLQIGTAQSVARIIGHLSDHSYQLILEHTYSHIEEAFLLLGLLYFAVVAQKRPIPRMVIPSLATAAIYYAGILAIYIQTPQNLLWHLNTSAGRTMLTVTGCVFVACFFLLDALEKQVKTNTVETS
jgi:hypothetical protein